jgi:hypothetical protein
MNNICNNIKIEKFHQEITFLELHSNADTHDTHTYSSLWTHMRKPYSYEHLQMTEHPTYL